MRLRYLVTDKRLENSLEPLYNYNSGTLTNYFNRGMYLKLVSGPLEFEYGVFFKTA
ncbi:MAG: hypothetical protein ACI9T7_001996 [Oleiphilaceae bacterium]|jgi:hypothetical protein